MTGTGCRATALDDFGAGHAGLNRLADIQPDSITLDMDPVRGIASSPARRTIVAAVTAVARDLGIAVITEGIETQAERMTLLEAGITICRGYLSARPAVARLPATASRQRIGPNRPPRPRARSGRASAQPERRIDP